MRLDRWCAARLGQGVASWSWAVLCGTRGCSVDASHTVAPNTSAVLPRLSWGKGGGSASLTFRPQIIF